MELLAAATRTHQQQRKRKLEHSSPMASIVISGDAAAAIAMRQSDAASDPAAVRVLTDHTLLCRATSFMPGFTQLVFEFQRDVVPLHPNPRKPLASDQYHRRLPSQLDEFPRPIGLWPHVAIETNDQRVLEALFALHRQPHYARMQCMSFAKVMRCAAFFGRLEMLQWMVRAFPAKDPGWVWEPELMEMALKNVATPPSLELLKWLDAHCPPVCREVCGLDKLIGQHATHGNLDVVRYFHDTHGHVPSQQVIDHSAASGNLELIRYFDERYPGSFTAHAIAYAASEGQLDVIKFLRENNRAAKLGSTAMDAAAKNGHVEVLRYLHEHWGGETCSKAAMDEASVCGHADVVKFLHVNHCNEGCTLEAMDKNSYWIAYFDYADYLDHTLEDLSYKEKFYEIEDTEFSCMETEADEAVHCTDGADLDARERHFQVTKFLHENRTEGCTEGAMDHAALRGHLEVVQFLHANRTEGCTTAAMDNAAWKGNLEIVQFLHWNRTEGCTTDAMDYAAREGHLEIVKFLHENRTEGCTASAIDFAAGRGHLVVVQFLMEHRTEGCTEAAMDVAAKRGYLDMVKFLHLNRSEGCTTDAMDGAARNGHLEIVKFLHENRSEGCTEEAMEGAACYGHLLVIKFLYEHRKEGCCHNWVVSSAIEAACHGNQLDIVRYLVDECGEECPPNVLHYMVDSSPNHQELVTYLYENLATRHLFDTLPVESWDSIHEVLKFAYLQHQDDPQRAAHQLSNAVAGNRALLVQLLCAYTTHGCLFEAKQVAMEHQNVGVVAILDRFLTPEVQSCSLAEHSFDTDPRRCQKKDWRACYLNLC